MGNNEGIFFDTRCAAVYLYLSFHTLDGYRVNVNGSAFHRLGNRVHHLSVDLDAWVAKRRATTAEADQPDAR